jgi:integrase
VASIDDRWYRRVNGRLVPADRNGNGMRWRVRYKTPAGQERSKSFARKADAERFRATTEADLIRGRWTDPASGRVLLADYARGWISGHAGEPTTVDQIRSRVETHIIPALGGFRLAELRPSQIQSFITALDVAPGTARGVLTTLGSILNAAVDDELIATNPVHRPSVRAPRVVRERKDCWTAEQVAAIRAALPERYRVICDIGAGCGLRIGEILGLDLDSAEMLPHLMHVRQQVRLVGGRMVLAPPKNHKERTLPLPEPVAQAIAAHLAVVPATEVVLPWRTPAGPPRRVRLLLSARAGHAVHRTNWNSQHWMPAVERAGMTRGRDAGPHQLRHRFASLMVANGVNVRLVAEWMGHQDGGALLLRTYSHLIPAEPDTLRRQMEAALAAGEPSAKVLQESRNL